MQKIVRLLLSAILSLVLVACGGKGDSASPPTDLAVTAGDAQVTLTWTMTPGVEYWVWYAPGTLAAGQDILQATGHRSLVKATSPYVLSGLVTGAPYTFTLDGRTGGGPGGPKAAFQYATPRPAGSVWSAPTTPASTLGSGDLRGVSFGLASDGNPYHLAVGSSGALYVAADPASWTTVPTSTSNISSHLRTASYAAGRFVVGDALGRVYYTTDFITWTAAAVPATGKQLNAMATNGTTAVAVGNDGTIWTTGDGANWSAAATVPTSNHLYGVFYGASGLNGVSWVAVGANGTLLLSSDANTWVVPTTKPTLTTSLNAAAYRPGYTFTDASTGTTLATYNPLYVAVGESGQVLVSSDGLNWTLQTNLGTTQNALSVTASQFLSVGANGTVFTSLDGLTWTSRTSGTTRDLFAVLNTMGLTNITARYVAVGASGTVIYAK